MKRLVIAISLVATLGLLGVVTAFGTEQSAVRAAATPVASPGTTTKAMLPDAGVIGKDWMLFKVSGTSLRGTEFKEGTFATYGGPAGARVIIIVWQTKKLLKAWESASKEWDRYRYRFAGGFSRNRELESAAPPPQCSEVKRAEGTDDYFGFPTAITLCAADPDKIVLVMLSGPIEGRTGYRMSDWIAAVVVAGPTVPKPTA